MVSLLVGGGWGDFGPILLMGQLGYLAIGFIPIGLALLVSSAFPRHPWSRGVYLTFSLVLAAFGVLLVSTGLWSIYGGVATPDEGIVLVNAGGILPVISVVLLASRYFVRSE